MMDNFTKMMSTALATRGPAARVALRPARAGVLGDRRGFEQDFTVGGFRGKAKMTLYGTRGVWALIMTAGATGTPETKQALFFDVLQINESNLEGRGERNF
jgi:hypothetical protein